VLLIDDEETWVRTQRRLLERASDRLHVSTALSFEAASSAVSETSPDCIVCDYQLGDGTGLDLLTMVRSDNAYLPFILVTGEGDEDVASDAIGEQVTDYIPKLHLSQQPTQLAERIESAVDADRTRQALTRERQSKEALLEMVTNSATRSELGENICEQLVAAGYACAWIAVLDADRGVVPLSTAGEATYLERAIIPGMQPVDSTEPTLVALDNTDSVVRALTVTDGTASDDDWTEIAVDHGFRSVAAVPIRHDELQFGVLTVYSNETRIDDHELDLLSAYAETVGYAFQTNTWKRALLSSATASVDFVLSGDCHPLVALNSNLSKESTLRTTTVIPRNDREVLYVTTVHGATATELSEAVKITASISSVDYYQADDNRIQCGLVATSPVPEIRLVDVGVSLSQTCIDAGRARMSIVLGEATTVSACVRVLSELCGEDSVTTVWTASEQPTPSRDDTVDELTARQRQVLKLAVEAGYFERPRHNNTGELADTLDISRATFTQHLRAAQRKLFESGLL